MTPNPDRFTTPFQYFLNLARFAQILLAIVAFSIMTFVCQAIFDSQQFVLILLYFK